MTLNRAGPNDSADQSAKQSGDGSADVSADGSARPGRGVRRNVARPAPDPTWYRDAVVYELNIRSFADSDGDGIGDIRGLTRRLEYLQDLGVTAIWLLPFYPSPLRDEGYDISDYRGINTAYGNLRQFRQFLDEAHRRELRVITELVLNHTSDQHPWFQRARAAPRGSRYRNWYVWGDDASRYRDARVIFRDFERSNWAWDDTAGQYYWHRFYSHQPDLNFDNPEVRREMLRTVEYWLEMGVDGLRLDAVPYLFEREGTSCENLPETHDFLKEVRRSIDARFPDRMLLAEANQWPEDAAAYFGDGDECQMAFHFPLMPRLFMGLRMEDRFPIVDILRQTPTPPDGCQWAVFLRNHDELTLEMVTDEERDYMYRAYARDPVARINLGIRRRLAPLLQNHRHKIELMYALLCSLPGTPVLYYGDEIGMGDNVYLGDRDSVRTPMQWSADRNAGFSEANPQRLYLPAIIDPEYSYESVNVAAQLDNPESLLWWVRRLIALRRRNPVFAHGTIELLTPDNHRVLAFLRRHEGRQVLVVANLSRYAQYVELDLHEFRGAHPVELFGQTSFPAIGDLPYLLTLGPHAFYWLALEPAKVADATTPATPLVSIVSSWTELLALGKASARDKRSALDPMLAQLLTGRRWFGAKGRTITTARLVDSIEMPMSHYWTAQEEMPQPEPARIALVRVEYADGDPETYALPLAFVPGTAGLRMADDNHPSVLVMVATPAGPAGVVVDAHWLPGYGRALARFMQRRRRQRGELGTLVGVSFGPELTRLEELDETAVSVLGGEQTNTSLLFDDRLILKSVRRLESGLSPEVELGRALTRVDFPYSPPLLGAVEYRMTDATTATVAVLHEYVQNESDAYSWYQDALGRFFDGVLSHLDSGVVGRTTSTNRHPLDLLEAELPVDFELIAGDILPSVELLGRRTGDLHVALASIPGDGAFTPEPINLLVQRSTYQSMRNTAARTLRTLERVQRRLPEAFAEEARFVVEHTDEVFERLRAMLGAQGGCRIRVHGDLHLGQVLSTGRDFTFIDFEGEPTLPITQRRIKRSPLRDVAGMLRSFDYAARTAIPDAVARGQVREERAQELLAHRSEEWVTWVTVAYLRGYFAVIDGTGLLPTDLHALRIQLDAHLIEKALYEIRYELDHRPDWVGIPIAGLRRLLQAGRVEEPA
jgi:maltose alpha-D-glucosyltransferase/alpha-amylase